MPYGYSYQFVRDVLARYEQDKDNPVFELGALAIKHNIMLSEIADELGVSKQALYKWLGGAYAPKKDAMKRINTVVKKLRKRK